MTTFRRLAALLAVVTGLLLTGPVAAYADTATVTAQTTAPAVNGWGP